MTHPPAFPSKAVENQVFAEESEDEEVYHDKVYYDNAFSEFSVNVLVSSEIDLVEQV
jgi:hypothetical protein